MFVNHSARASKKDMEGIIFSAHTYCGRISLRTTGPLRTATEPPREANCGFYQIATRLLWVSPAVGSNLLPTRLGAQWQRDLLTLLEE